MDVCGRENKNCTIECRAENGLLTKCISVMQHKFFDIGIRVLFVWHFSIQRIQIKKRISSSSTSAQPNHFTSWAIFIFNWKMCFFRCACDRHFSSPPNPSTWCCLYLGIATRNCICYLCFDGILFLRIKIHWLIAKWIAYFGRIFVAVSRTSNNIQQQPRKTSNSL